MASHTRFYSSLSLLLLLNVLIKPLWIFGIDRQVQVLAGNEAYGHYFSLLNLSLVFVFAADMGLTPFLNRQLAVSGSGTGNLLPFLKQKLLFGLIYLFLVLSAAFLTGIQQWDILLYVMFIQLFTSLFVFLRAIITARQQFKTDAWLSIADKTLMIVICGSFLYLPFAGRQLAVDRFLQVQLFSMLVACGLAAWAIFRYRPEQQESNLSTPVKALWPSLWPFALVVFLMSTHNRLDGFLLELLHPAGAVEAGIYASAYRLLDVANMAGYLLISFLFPYIARQWSRQQSIESVVLQCRHLLLSFAIGVAAAAWWLAPWMQQVLYKQTDPYAASVLQWSLPALIGYSLVHIYGTILSATGQIRLYAFLTTGAVLLNTLLNIWLIPSQGAKGAALAALISETALGLLLAFVVAKKTKLSYHLPSVALYILIAILASASLYAGLHFSVNKGLLLSGTGLLVIILLMLSGILSVKSIKSLISKN